MSLRERYEVSGIEPPEIAVPDAASHVWSWFWRLSSRRQAASEGVNPITYTEIRSWSELTGRVVAPDEVEMIADMDDAYVSEILRRRETNRQQKKERDEAVQRSKNNLKGKRA